MAKPLFSVVTALGRPEYLLLEQMVKSLTPLL